MPAHLPPGTPSPRRRPPALWLVVLVMGGLGLLTILLAAVVGAGIITWDVKGRLLTGPILAVFSFAVGAVGAIALVAAHRLWRGTRWARPLAVGFWGAAGGLALITDRSVPGAGEPLRTYLVDMMLVPGGVTALLLYAVPSVRRYFDRSTRYSS